MNNTKKRLFLFPPVPESPTLKGGDGQKLFRAFGTGFQPKKIKKFHVLTWVGFTIILISILLFLGIRYVSADCPACWCQAVDPGTGGCAFGGELCPHSDCCNGGAGCSGATPLCCRLCATDICDCVDPLAYPGVCLSNCNQFCCGAACPAEKTCCKHAPCPDPNTCICAYKGICQKTCYGDDCCQQPCHPDEVCCEKVKPGCDPSVGCECAANCLAADYYGDCPGGDCCEGPGGSCPGEKCCATTCLSDPHCVPKGTCKRESAPGCCSPGCAAGTEDCCICSNTCHCADSGNCDRECQGDDCCTPDCTGGKVCCEKEFPPAQCMFKPGACLCALGADCGNPLGPYSGPCQDTCCGVGGGGCDPSLPGLECCAQGCPGTCQCALAGDCKYYCGEKCCNPDCAAQGKVCCEETKCPAGGCICKAIGACSGYECPDPSCCSPACGGTDVCCTGPSPAPDCATFCARPYDPNTDLGYFEPQGTNCLCQSGVTDFEDLLMTLIKYIFWVATVLVPILIIIGAFFVITSGGDIEKVSKGKRLIIYALAGYIIILFAWGIVYTVKNILGQ